MPYLPNADGTYTYYDTMPPGGGGGTPIPAVSELYSANETIASQANWQALATATTIPSLTDDDFYYVSPGFGVASGAVGNTLVAGAWIRGSELAMLTKGTVGMAKDDDEEFNIGWGVVIGLDASNNVLLGNHRAGRNPTPLTIIRFDYS